MRRVASSAFRRRASKFPRKFLRTENVYCFLFIRFARIYIAAERIPNEKYKKAETMSGLSVVYFVGLIVWEMFFIGLSYFVERK